MNLLDGATTPNDDTDRDAILAKWKDKPLEDVLKAKVDSDLYIKTLERQKDELREMYDTQREELLAKAKFEEYIDQIKKSPTGEVTPPIVKEVETKPFDPAEIEKLVSLKIQEAESKKKDTENFNRVQSKLKEKYGDNYVSILKDQQINLGLSDQDVNSLAMKSPEAFFRMLGLNEQQTSFNAPPRSAQRNDSFSPKVQKRDYYYYQELKKANPKLYLDPKIQVQMHNDAIELGSAFGLPD